MELNFDFGPDTINRKPAETTTQPQVVQQTPFDQDERFSLIKAELSFAEISDKLTAMRDNAISIDVKDAESNNTAMEMLVQCRALIKAADKAKQGIAAYKVASRFKNGVDTFVREKLRKPIEQMERILNPKIGSYQKAQAELQRRIDQKNAEIERKRVEEETKKREKEAQKEHEKKLKEAEELQAKLNKEADKEGVDRVQVNTPEFVEPEIITPSAVTPITRKTEAIKTDQGKATVKSRWTCIVFDADKVPREYCQPNQRALDAAVETGIRKINGCKIEEIFVSTVRMSSRRPQAPFGADDRAIL